MKTIFAFVLGSLLASSALADQSFSMKTKKGKLAQFQFHMNTPTVTIDTASATVCVKPAATLKDVVLWMPDPHHNHGSTPVDIEHRAGGCALVSAIDFSMPGVWELRTSFTDGDSGVLSIHVDG